MEGPALKEGSRVALVDDVATTGKSLIEAKETLDKIGAGVSEGGFKARIHIQNRRFRWR